MDQAAADKVAEDLGFKWANGLHAPDTLDTPDSAEAIQAADGYHKVLWNHAVSLQSQISASEERVREQLEIIRDRAQGELEDAETLVQARAGLQAIASYVESLLPSPPQVDIRG